LTVFWGSGARVVKKLKASALFGADAGPRLVGEEGEVLDECESTMSAARARLEEGAHDGYVVLAEHQTAGRGREGAWECPPGLGLLVSVILKRGLAPDDRKLLSIMGAVAAAEAVRHHGVDAGIKWPNDVVAPARPRELSDMRKLGGVLVESVPRGDAAPAHVLGIGLNVNHAAGDLPECNRCPPASMRTERGRRFDRAAVCRTLLNELDVWYRRLVMGQHDPLLARWRELSCLLGHQIRATSAAGELAGEVVGVLASGELLIRDVLGRTVPLSAETARLAI
jgi:BirA family biotin operon repressor/biotin-[acetyl-CoA-carboxylase] ligase